MTSEAHGPAGPLAAPVPRIRQSSTTTRIPAWGSRPVQSSSVACSKTTFTARLVYLRRVVGQKEVGDVAQQKSKEQSPAHCGRRVEPAAGVAHLVDHVEQGAGGERQEEHIDGRTGEDIAESGAG